MAPRTSKVADSPTEKPGIPETMPEPSFDNTHKATLDELREEYLHLRRFCALLLMGVKDIVNRRELPQEAYQKVAYALELAQLAQSNTAFYKGKIEALEAQVKTLQADLASANRAINGLAEYHN